jgi:chitinase
MPRHKRGPGLLPRPLAILGALALTAATGVAIRLLPAGAAQSPPPQSPSAARHSPAVSPAVAAASATAFVGFVDTAREPGFDLPAVARRTGVRHYALGHLVATGTDGCTPKWAGPLEPASDSTDSTDRDAGGTDPDEGGGEGTDEPDADGSDPAERDAEGTGSQESHTDGIDPDTGEADSVEPDADGTGTSEPDADETGTEEPDGPDAGRGDPLDPGENPVANKIGRLRALGGDAVPVFGGPEGEELATTCTRPGGLAAAYRRVVGAFDAAAIDFEISDSENGAAVLRRARAIRAMQRERPLRVSFTLPLKPYGLGAGDVAMLRTTRQAGAEVGTVNLLAAMEPRSGPDGRLRRLSTAILLARDQIAQAQHLPDAAQAWRRIALTPVLTGEGDLSEFEARTLTGYAARHGLAWLSLRGVTPSRQVSRILAGA